MSKAPNSRSSLGRSPSVETENRRASTHSLNLSYAYGAPRAHTTPQMYAGSFQLRGNSSTAGSSGQAGAGAGAGGAGGTPPSSNNTGGAGDTGRAAESAAVRYARLSQRKKDTGGNAYPPPPPVGSYSGLQNTSVNIANAFKAATSGLGGVVTGGRKEDFPDPDPDPEGEEEEEADEEENKGGDGEEGQDGNGASASPPGKAPQSAGRKRKKHGHRDPTYQDQPGQSSSSDDSEYDQSRGQKKRTKVHSNDNDHVDDPAAINKPRRRSQKPVDPTYRPSSDPNFRAGQTTTSDYEAGSPKRRRSKSKGRSSTGGRSVAQDAIPRGIRDGEIWYGKKRKGKRGSRKSTAGVEEDDMEEQEEEEDDEEGGEDNAEAQDMGGMHPNEHDGALDDEDEDAEEGDDTPPAASYFLRLKSPSPPPGQQAGSTSQGRSAPRSAGQPSNVGASTSRQPIDPASAAFDRSLGATGQDSNSLTASFVDDSVLRGSSYDYSEEERIMQALEAQKRQRIERQQQQQPSREAPPVQQRQSRVSHQPTPKAAPNPATPIISNGGYPATPNAGPVSPVTAFRKRRLPGPPSMLGAGTPLGAPADDNEDELDELVRAEKMGGKWGRKCGNALRPLVQFAGRAWQKTQDPLLNWPRILKALAAALLALSLLVAIVYYDLIPLPSRAAPTTAYVTPSAPPDSLEGVIARLADLESAMGRLSTASGVDRQHAASDRQAAKELQNQFRELEYNLHAEQTRSRETLDTIDRENAKQAKEVERGVGAVKTELEALKSKLQQATEAQKSDGNSLRVLQHEISEVTSQLAAVQSQVAKAARDAAIAADADRITKLALEAIGKKLPGKIAVWMDESGRLDIDPSFWRVLKDAFVDKKAVNKAVDTKLANLDGARRASLFGAAKDGKAPVAAPSAPTWDTFIAENEEALRGWVASDLSSRVGSEAFVSKRTFLDLLDRKLKTVQRDFNEKVNDNFEQMGQEILAKVAKQDEMRRKEASTHGGLHLNPFARHGHAADSTASGPHTIKGSDGQNVTAVISSLVDSALLRYSKDVLARPDYALYTSGGRVIRSLTSPSYEPYRLGRVRSTMAWITGAAVPQSRPPVTALHPDTSPGSCWPFAGPHGQLGIQLSRRIVPTDITLEHISSDVALDADVSSAPKDFEVWGIVESAEDVAKVAKYRHEQLQAKRAAREAGSTLEDDLDSTPASVPESANHILLASGAYDPSAPSPVQTFPVTVAARQLGVPVQVVIVKILSNHGESAYTCLYRVRVSGTTEAQLDAATTSHAA
ncbi:hypothetical protein JCM10908_005302 [Rhodotorula pacifica]|uniref:uncharacterized protein n=1 Tax=Rhodotorula pacifica TaxID=1495444 RepID=UPI0031730B5C